MSLTLNQIETTEIERVAASYRQKGYIVQVEPSADELPPFLIGFQPDIIAISDKDKVVIEVKPGSALTTSPYLEKMAEVVQKAQWRLELVVLRSERNGFYADNATPLPTFQVREGLKEADVLVKSGHPEAGFLIGWGSVEAVLRMVAQKQEIDLKKPVPAYLIKNLAFLGILTQDDYDNLWNFLKIRNSLVQGYKVEQNVTNFVEILNEIAQRLLSELE